MIPNGYVTKQRHIRMYHAVPANDYLSAALRKGAAGAFSSTQSTSGGGSTYNFTIDYSLVTGGSVVVGGFFKCMRAGAAVGGAAVFMMLVMLAALWASHAA